MSAQPQVNQDNTRQDGIDASNVVMLGQRARMTPATESLPSVVDKCLDQYFEDLGGMSPPPGLYEKVISHVEKPLIEHVLRYVRGNQVRAASLLGINRNTLRKKINNLGIDVSSLNGR